MKKHLRFKFISSLIMTVFAFCTVVSSSYAWFSMNNTAAVTGLEIEVTNDYGYLIIGTKAKTEGASTPTITSLRAANLTTVDLSDQYASTKCLPVAHKAISSITEADSITDSKYDNWYMQVADDPTASTSTKDESKLTTYAGYLLYYDLYLTVAKGSVNVKDLKCSATIQESGDAQNLRDSVRVFVVSDSASEEFYNAHKENGTSVEAHTTGETVLKDKITEADTDPVHIRVYVYSDGNDDSVYTNNILNLKSTTISLSFSVENDVE